MMKIFLKRILVNGFFILVIVYAFLLINSSEIHSPYRRGYNDLKNVKQGKKTDSLKSKNAFHYNKNFLSTPVNESKSKFVQKWQKLKMHPMYRLRNDKKAISAYQKNRKFDQFPSKDIPLVIVLCCRQKHILEMDDHSVGWKRQKEQLGAMFWSLLTFSKVYFWRVVVLVDSLTTYNLFLKLFSNWAEELKSRLLFEMQMFQLPDHYLANSWRPCSWTKIFLDIHLPQFEVVIYSDTDMIFLGPAEDLWLEVSKLKGQQFLALAPEPWYGAETDVRRTKGGKLGLNTGILIMNLRKSRNLPSKFSESIMKEIPSVNRPRHDQDIVNSFLAKNPQYFFELSPRFNFVLSVCALNITCEECREKGIVILHGADSSFYRTVETRYNVIFAIMNEATASPLTTRPELLLKLRTHLMFMKENSVKGSCQDYPNFMHMVLHNLLNQSEANGST